jgi:hypothetical protein
VGSKGVGFWVELVDGVGTGKRNGVLGVYWMNERDE